MHLIYGLIKSSDLSYLFSSTQTASLKGTQHKRVENNRISN